ncbi:sugar phosphate isomerase/epimerase family protein [Candidatus Hecatella orcuttiae]|uniref:sugar phosphate isomerase/epimerase family protein n=1 Tax=Candidatus Hecatella orcuttiae TaxID=1935119 RepID=UPI0028681B16|nr:sugar phosphate isomerase/epimerase family protein [Candidatus Hecatella orcuttiae]
MSIPAQRRCGKPWPSPVRIGLPSNMFLRERLEESLRLLAEVKPECMELVLDTPHFNPESLRKISLPQLKRTLSSFPALSVHSSFYGLNMGSSHEELRRLTLKLVKKCASICEGLGSSVLTVHPGYFPVPEMEASMKRAEARFVEDLKKCCRYTGDRGVTLCLENLHVRYFFFHSLPNAAHLVEEVEEMKITLDIGHAYLFQRSLGDDRPEETISQQIEAYLKGLVAHVHLHDNDGLRDSHKPPGQGSINFQPIIQALKAIGYSGQVIVELWNPENPEKTGKATLNKVKRLFRSPRKTLTHSPKDY